MTRLSSIKARVLAVDPTHRGFGYAIFEGPDLLVDWGERNIRGQKNAGSVEGVARLIERYKPDVLVMEDPTSSGCRRWPRVQLLIRELGEQAVRMKVGVRRISRAKVTKTFAASGASTKYQIAKLIASRLPELAPRLPPERKPWMSEDPRMGIFDAPAFGLAFFSGANHSSARRKNTR